MDPLEQELRIARLREQSHVVGQRTALEDLWLEDAYEAEAAGNFAKYNYILGWVRRVPELLQPRRKSNDE